MSGSIHRRQVLGAIAAGAAGAGVWSAAATAQDTRSANDRLNLAFVGVGGRGRANLDALAKLGENVVALCDVDQKRAGNAFQQHAKAERFEDYRRLLDKLGSRLDGIVISTPDHTHAHPALMAMDLGLHCYCEKPMAHSIYETRLMTEMARRKGVATQLGAQRHALANVHRVVELVKAGALGPIRECYAWIGGDRGMPQPATKFPPVPDHLNWDLWLGPALERPYSPSYAPYDWRFWWDFGTGETGNWGCHILDIPFWALDLSHCNEVSATGPPRDDQRTPRSMHAVCKFPARDDHKPLTLHWMHTNKQPEVAAQAGLPHYKTGVLFVGERGMLLSDFGRHQLHPQEQFQQRPEVQRLPNSPGFYKEWTVACKGGPAASCHFDYTGPMSETVLLGNLAYRVGESLRWDAANMDAGNAAAAAMIRPQFRKGWEM